MCSLANICNHTNTPECGREKNDLELRMFLDECDRIEYNCDNKKDYHKIPYEECELVYKDQTINNLFTKQSITTSSDDVGKKTNSEFWSETSETPKYTDSFTPNEKLQTNLSQIKSCTCQTKNKQIPTPVIQMTTTVTETDATVENLITPRTNIIKKLYLNKNKSAPTTSNTENSATEILTNDKITSNTENSTTEILSADNITLTTESSTTERLSDDNITYTTENSTTEILSDDNITSNTENSATEMLSNVTMEQKCTRNKNATIDPNHNTSLSTYTPTLSSVGIIIINHTFPSTHLTDTAEVSTSNEIISTTTKKTITETDYAKENEITKNITPTTTIKPTDVQKISCATKPYPKDCNRPSSWETTVKGETRDFFQILRSRYGNKFKTLKGTTHWPRRFNYFNGISYDFFFSSHNES